VEHNIELFYPFVPDEAILEVSKVLRTKWIGQGAKVDQFEKDFEKLFNIKHAVTLNSGTAALETAYDLLGLKSGDEVISTPLTCTASNLPLMARGVKIVWADILEDTLTLDPKDVQSKITDKTKAIVNVHLGGVVSDLGKMPVPIVSDACQALGAFVGDYTCCSFQAIKHITTGDGGMLITENDEDYKKAKLMRWFGIDREKKIVNNWKAYKQRRMTFDIEVQGYKRQMTDIAATMGIVGLKHYDSMLKHRLNLFNIYKYRLRNMPDVKIINGDRNYCWLMTILVEHRDDFTKMLFENSIDSNLVQVRNDIYKIFGGKRTNLPAMNKIEDKYLSIPLGMHVSEDDVNYICDVIKKGW